MGATALQPCSPLFMQINCTVLAASELLLVGSSSIYLINEDGYKTHICGLENFCALRVYIAIIVSCCLIAVRLSKDGDLDGES